MANLCDFEMRVKGRNINMKKFMDALTQKNNIYIGRGADACIDYDDEEDESEENTATVSGYCKWSIWSSLIDNAVSMRKTPKAWYHEKGEENLTFITLIEASTIYDLDIEVFSSEPGVGFEEHYYIEKGNMINDECVDYTEIYVGEFETKEEAEEEYEIKIPDEEWDNADDYIKRGGFNWDFKI